MGIFAGYNFADKYAFDFFTKYGFNVKTALFFCNSFTTRPVVWQSAYLFNYCNYMNQNYGRGNEHIPTYPNAPDNMPDQDVPSYPSQNLPSYPEQSPPAQYPEQSAYLFNYCNYMNQNYGRGNEHIPTYPNAPDNMPDQDVPSYPSQNLPSYPEQSPPAQYPEQNSSSTYPEQSVPEQYPSQDGYPSNDAPQKLY
uniref:Synaptogyrin-1 n=1 Tax=Strongyloides papillosus TaxID=174720 RepID=A0A0N5CI70_STREA